MRLDTLMVKKNLVSSRQRAKELIVKEQVIVNDKICSKPSKEFEDEDNIIIQGNQLKYVGRGGLKLEKMICHSTIILKDFICMDIGASTGGFTDCMLQNGAKKVYAVDVGHSQLSEKLKNDNRVINLEKTDIRTLPYENITDVIDFITVDVSFIALHLILKDIFRFLKDNGYAVILIKPQFEAGKENIGKNGIVKSKKVHINVLKNIESEFHKAGFSLEELIVSPIRGGSGNIEYVSLIKKSNVLQSKIFNFYEIVERAFSDS